MYRKIVVTILRYIVFWSDQEGLNFIYVGVGD